MSDQLVPISTISKLSGVSKIHLAYLTKLRLIPQTIRRKVDGAITGCYPESVLKQLQKIEGMKDRGLTYSQIRFAINSPAALNFNINGPAFLIIGLVLGYIVANLRVSAPTAVASVPADTKLTVRHETQSDPVYLIAIPEKNLYKLGKLDINSLVSN